MDSIIESLLVLQYQFVIELVLKSSKKTSFSISIDFTVYIEIVQQLKIE